MRILFISNLYPPYELGGYAQWCQEVADGLRARGHELQILTSRHGVAENGNVLDAGVQRLLHLQSDIHYYQPSHFFLKRPQQEKENQQAVTYIIQQFQPDVVMVWGMWNLSLNVAYEAERQLPNRVAYFVSSYWPMDTDAHTAYWQLPANRQLTEWVKRPLRHIALKQLATETYPPALFYHHAVCCSAYVRNRLVQAGRLPESAGVLYGGTDPVPFQRTIVEKTAEQPVNFLYFGRLSPDKGVHTALEALSLLQKQQRASNVRLTILGSGHPDYEAHLQNMVQKEGLTEQVTFVGRVPRSDVPSWLKRFDAYLFTSIWPEPMARSVMEAMAAGLLVIGTEVGGQVEMLYDGENSLTFPAEDATRLAQQIDLAASNPTLRYRLACAGQEMVLERFTLTRMVSEIEEMLLGIGA